MTESSPAVFISRNSSLADFLTVGPPISNTKAKVVDPMDNTVEYGPGEVGEILVNGPQVRDRKKSNIINDSLANGY